MRDGKLHVVAEKSPEVEPVLAGRQLQLRPDQLDAMTAPLDDLRYEALELLELTAVLLADAPEQRAPDLDGARKGDTLELVVDAALEPLTAREHGDDHELGGEDGRQWDHDAEREDQREERERDGRHYHERLHVVLECLLRVTAEVVPSSPGCACRPCHGQSHLHRVFLRSFGRG